MDDGSVCIFIQYLVMLKLKCVLTIEMLDFECKPLVFFPWTELFSVS